MQLGTEMAIFQSMLSHQRRIGVVSLKEVKDRAERRVLSRSTTPDFKKCAQSAERVRNALVTAECPAKFSVNTSRLLAGCN